MSSMKTKITALLAKAAGTDNQIEAEAFLAKAHELMEKHQIDSADLGEGEKIYEELVSFRKGRVAPDWDFRLTAGVARYYGCEAIRQFDTPSQSWSYILIGKESARVTTVEMHKYLVSVVKKLGKDNSEKMGLNAQSAARRIGSALNLRLLKLAEDAKPQPKSQSAAAKNALATLDQVEAYIKANHTDISYVNSRTIGNTTARSLANGISLNLQAGHSSAKRIGG